MSSPEEKRKELASYRIKQAEESLDEARYLLSGGKSPRSIMNRIYYAMFYSVLALLIYEPYSSSKHSGVLSYFNKNFIRNEVFDKEMGRTLNKAFELRQREDYREYSHLTALEATDFIEKAEAFVKKVSDYLKQMDKI
ncbi:HEPN domain-containing protein [Desulfonatronovibrio magnus]|uniref:HEPN domain-containing protein n=1 Tax=Desulfonatronovibrio magnus TaxID=698827 RepID=UPI0005EB1643|nr:HEPN domain-containing protein [Desulfonatronovibrio magnus]